MFTLVGAAAAIVSLARPEGESFETRARILFRRQNRKPIDDIVRDLPPRLENCSEHTTVAMTFQHYDRITRRLSNEKVRLTEIASSFLGFRLN